MNQLKDHPFLAGIVIAAVLFGGVSAYFAWQSFGVLEEERMMYEQSVAQLHGLQNASPYPNVENLERLQEEVETYRTHLLEFEQRLEALQPPVEPTSPELFQDELRQVVSELTRNAAREGVELPAEFYLGFDEYRANLPGPEAAPYLLQQMEVLKGIVNKLIQSGVTRVDRFVRHQIPAERGAVVGGDEQTELMVLVPSLLDLTVTGDQGRVHRVLNELVHTPQFLIVRSLELENSNKASPLRTGMPGDPGLGDEPPQQEDDFATFFTDPQVQEGTDLEIIFGREKITAKMRIELIDFLPLNLALIEGEEGVE